MTTRLTYVRAPTPQEAEAGAWIVFVREGRGETHIISASYYEGSYQQWGAVTPVLGDNVEAVSAWADGMREVMGMVRDEDGEQEEAEARGYTVNEKAPGQFVFNDPDGNDDDSPASPYATEAECWIAAADDMRGYGVD